MADINPTISITLNTNGLSNPIKRQRFRLDFLKNDLTICCLQKIYFSFKDVNRLKVKGCKVIYHANNHKKAGVAILISDKQTLMQTKKFTGNKEGHFIMIKWSIHQ